MPRYDKCSDALLLRVFNEVHEKGVLEPSDSATDDATVLWEEIQDYLERSHYISNYHVTRQGYELLEEDGC